MRLVTVGSGTVVPDAERGSACHWIETDGTRIVADCGAGALPGLARAGLPWHSVDHLLITHFHADHIGEIPSLIFALKHGTREPREAPLGVWGPVGTVELFRALAAAYGPWILDPGFEVDIREVEPGRMAPLGSVKVFATRTPHTEESLAYRFETDEGPALGYTGDTGPSESLERFFQGTHTLLAECSLPDDEAIDIHLTPSQLARLASGAGVERLAVTHVYPQLRELDVPMLIRAGGYTGEITMVSDGQELII